MNYCVLNSKIFFIFTANLTGFTFGIILGWSSISARSLLDKKAVRGLVLEKNEYALVVAIMSLGGAGKLEENLYFFKYFT